VAVPAGLGDVLVTARLERIVVGGGGGRAEGFLEGLRVALRQIDELRRREPDVPERLLEWIDDAPGRDDPPERR
jgi:hypothetical protein